MIPRSQPPFRNPAHSASRLVAFVFERVSGARVCHSNSFSLLNRNRASAKNVIGWNCARSKIRRVAAGVSRKQLDLPNPPTLCFHWRVPMSPSRLPINTSIKSIVIFHFIIHYFRIWSYYFHACPKKYGAVSFSTLI